MTPGTVVKAGQIYLLALFPLKGDSRRPCTVLMDEPYVNPDGIIDVVMTPERQFYLVPGIAMLQPETLAQLQVVTSTDRGTAMAIAFSPAVSHQVQQILRSESAPSGHSPEKGPSFSPKSNDSSGT